MFKNLIKVGPDKNFEKVYNRMNHLEDRVATLEQQIELVNKLLRAEGI